MSRYVSPDRRRRRRHVDGPEGDEPAEFTPQRVVRVMRCPKCRETIGTMRRWRMLCTECGHEWEEASERSAADKLADARTEVGEYIVMAMMWGGLLLLIGLVLGGSVLLGIWIAGTTGGLVLAAFLIPLLLVMGGASRGRNEAMARYSWWSRGWRDRP
jgi:hypothetical protein